MTYYTNNPNLIMDICLCLRPSECHTLILKRTQSCSYLVWHIFVLYLVSPPGLAKSQERNGITSSIQFIFNNVVFLESRLYLVSAIMSQCLVFSLPTLTNLAVAAFKYVSDPGPGICPSSPTPALSHLHYSSRLPITITHWQRGSLK